MKKPELLAPAGTLEKLKIAIMYGADAVFIGGKAYSLRARASNFGLKEIEEAVQFAHAHDSKVYVTTNVIPHTDDLDGLVDYLKALEARDVDAIICASTSVVDLARKHTNLEIHLSTQQSITNSKAIEFWQEKGVKRIVLARELSLDEIATVQQHTTVDLEVFIHGGMCVSYSGKCTLSNNMTNRDANRGGCAHSCRWDYDIFDNGEQLNVSMPFSMSSKDLQTVKFISRLVDIGVDSLKIEGRMKSIHYIATVVDTYRRLIDDLCDDLDVDIPKYLLDIKKAENRLTSHGFMQGMTTVDEQLYNLRSEQPTQAFIGLVKSYDSQTKEAVIEQRNYFEDGDLIEIFSPNFQATSFIAKNMTTEDGEALDVARHPKQIIKLKVPFPVSPYDMVRKVLNE
jgi:putative protease